jgi:aspartyl-tRNA(Asn)/glutamyl-tRNA(Gln) amidotransferase subunit B
MYTPTIGLEVHAELKTNSKMFCPCKNNPHRSEPNTNICPICMGHPGTLPLPNEEAIRSVLLFGTAVKGTIADFSEFDRKNYFYPDIPKAYQISQYAYPLVTGGSIAGVALTRVHLEEDTARSQHDKGDYSLVDFNRAGVPLMELVTEPVIHDASTASAFAKELQLLLRTLGISDANMEKGEMRIEANISVSNTDELGTKVEVKNLNSFRSVESAISFEIHRQIAEKEAGREVYQETRGWDEQKQVTFVQRSKETAKDYRYFPDPDIPKLKISEYEPFNASRLAEIMPLLPEEKRSKYRNLGLQEGTIDTILANVTLDAYLSEISIQPGASNQLVVTAANYLLTDVLPQVGETPIALPSATFVQLITYLLDKKVTSRVVKDMIIEFISVDTVDITTVLTERNLFSTNDPAALRTLVQEIISEHATVVADFKAGKETALKFLVGQGMKKSKGSVDPISLEEAIRASIA